VIYIKVAVFTIILGLISAGRLLFQLPIGPEYMLCLSIAYAFVDREKTHAVIMSAILALVSSAITDRHLLFCFIEYGITACFISEIFTKRSKWDIVLCAVITVCVTLIGESVFYRLFILNKMAVIDFVSIITRECAANFGASVIIYIIIFKIFNPKKRRFRITVE